MDGELLDLKKSEYDHIVGNDELKRDKDGFVILRPRAKVIDQRMSSLTTSIDTLEDKLKDLRRQHAETAKLQKTPEYAEDKKKEKKGKKKKERERLIAMVFSNADQVNEEKEAEEDKKATEKGTERKPRKKPQTTLETTYGQRFSPIVSMLNDTINDFDRIAKDIEAELSTPAGRARTRYRSDQTSNMISAKNSQLSALKELGTIAKQLSDLEYRRDKDSKSEDDKDSTKAISNLAAKYLRTSNMVGGIDISGGKKKNKKGKKDKDKSQGNFAKTAINMGYAVDDDEDEDNSLKKTDDDTKHRGGDHDLSLAKEFAKVLEKRRDEISFSPYERHLDMEGKYKFIVACDPLDPEHTWDFIPVDPKTNKEIKGFRKDYKELMPKKKQCRMRFDLQKMRCTDLNSSKNYKIVLLS